MQRQERAPRSTANNNDYQCGEHAGIMVRSTFARGAQVPVACDTPHQAKARRGLPHRMKKSISGRPEISAHFVSFNFTNNLICTVGSSMARAAITSRSAAWPQRERIAGQFQYRVVIAAELELGGGQLAFRRVGECRPGVT